MAYTIRPATVADLLPATRVWLEAERQEPLQFLAPPSVLPHMLENGLMLVAEQEGGDIVGFAAAFTRSDVTFLAQLFILPDYQSGGLGSALLHRVMPDDGTVRATVSSPDPRAIALYIRHSMRPYWGVYDVSASSARLSLPGGTAIDIVAAEPGDRQLIDADATIGGRHRPEEHHYWLEKRGGMQFWCERAGRRVGYGYYQVQSRGDDAEWGNVAVRIGPMGVFDAADAVDCLLAAVRNVPVPDTRVTMLVPGPHPAFPALLEAGFMIGDRDTFHSAGLRPFVDSQRYVPSGGGLY